MKAARFALCVVVLVAGGCHVGPTWDERVELPALIGDASGKTVVVSGYRESTTDVSVTQSATLETTRESVRVHDNSVELVARLREFGIPAEARAGVGLTSLGPNEILVRGGVVAMPEGHDPMVVFPTMTFALSFMVLGGILPSPVPFNNGVDVSYFVEILDHEGRWLLQTGDATASAHFSNYYVWGWDSSGDAAPHDVAESVTQQIGEQLAERLK
jgi:hypothetical protein